MELQENLFAHKFFELDAGSRTHLFEHLALATNDDTLLRVASHIYYRANAVDGGLLLVLLNGNLHRVGNLFVVVEEDFFAGNL